MKSLFGKSSTNYDFHFSNGTIVINSQWSGTNSLINRGKWICMQYEYPVLLDVNNMTVHFSF